MYSVCCLAVTIVTIVTIVGVLTVAVLTICPPHIAIVSNLKSGGFKVTLVRLRYDSYQRTIAATITILVL